jgi:alpha-tubulin suppressor-like RCC1 family protein
MSSVYAWGACAIPEHFKPLLTNVQIKMIFSTALCFLVLFENGRVLGWRKRMSPHEVEANKIDINDETQKVVNVFPRNFDVTFLFENRNVRTLNLNWRQQDYLTIDDLDLEEEGEHGQGYGHENAHEDGDEYENQYDFAAISENGDVHTWGPADSGGVIPEEIKPNLKNVKMICSLCDSFCALTSFQAENEEIMSSVYAWGKCVIPESFKPLLTNVQIKMIFSTALCFLVLFENGRVLGWRKRMSPHEVEANKIDINDETQKVVNVFPRNFDVTFLFENRNVRTLNLNWRQQDYLTIDDLDLEEEGEHGQGYGHENAHEDGDEYENQYDFEDN